MPKKILFSIAIFACFSSLTLAKVFTINTERADTAEVFNVVDEMPEIQGGIQKLYESISYPRSAKVAKIEGRVFIKFIVEVDGSVTNATILKDIGGGCGNAAIEGIKKVKFKPGLHQGEPVRVFFTLPVTFKLQN